jgi:DNA repair protein RadC
MKQSTQVRTHHNQNGSSAKAQNAPNITKDYKIVCLRETVLPNSATYDTPESATEYWHKVIASHPYFDPERECLAVLFLDTRRKVKGNQLLATGTFDTILVHPREIFRTAIIAASAAIIVMHNHPSGDSTPSEADIKITRDLLKAAQLLKIELLDHVIVGRATDEHPRGYTSLRELGYFFMDSVPDYHHRKPARLSKGALVGPAPRRLES